MEGEPYDQENDEYLPDLPDEISGEQLVLQMCIQGKWSICEST